MKFRDNWGSTISLYLGGLLILSGFGSISNIDQMSEGIDNVFAGIIIIISANIYRSAKRRRSIGSKKISTISLELIGLLVVLLLAFGIRNPLYRISVNPIPNFGIPIWAITAYLYGLTRSLIPSKGAQKIDDVFS